MDRGIIFIDEYGSRNIYEQIKLDDLSFWAKSRERIFPNPPPPPAHERWRPAPLSALMHDTIRHKNEHHV
jgi:hypothetical protein